jgi:hypothetical protein
MRPMSPIEPENNVEKYDKRILTFSTQVFMVLEEINSQ